MAYSALPEEQRNLVDQGQIRVGMNMDAIYVAWGKPSEVVQSEDADGLAITWYYHGTWAEELRYWGYRENLINGQMVLERYLVRDYNPRTYIRAEITFVKNKVVRWRTLPKPAN